MANSFPQITWLTKSGSWPSFSPDGSQIVYVDGGKLFTVPTAGGKPTLLYTPPKGQQATRPDWSWSPLIAFALGSGNEQTIWLINPEGSNPSQFPNQDGLTASIYPSWYQNLQSIVVMETMNPDFASALSDLRNRLESTGAAHAVIRFLRGAAESESSGNRRRLRRQAGRVRSAEQPDLGSCSRRRRSRSNSIRSRAARQTGRRTGSGFSSSRTAVPAWAATTSYGSRAPVPNGPATSPQPVTPPNVFVSHGEWSRQQNLIVFDNADHGEGIGIITVPAEFQGTA